MNFNKVLNYWLWGFAVIWLIAIGVFTFAAAVYWIWQNLARANVYILGATLVGVITAWAVHYVTARYFETKHAVPNTSTDETVDLRD